MKSPVFTCPVSAIPSWMWDLFELFMQSRYMRMPVVEGGLAAQPLIVRRAFPIWAQEMDVEERTREAQSKTADTTSLMAMLTTVLTVRRGGR